MHLQPQWAVLDDFVTKRSVHKLQRLVSRMGGIFQKIPPGTFLRPVQSGFACEVPQAAGQDPGELLPP